MRTTCAILLLLLPPCVAAVRRGDASWSVGRRPVLRFRRSRPILAARCFRLPFRERPRGGTRSLAIRRRGRGARRLPALGEGDPEGRGRRDAPEDAKPITDLQRRTLIRLAPEDVRRPRTAPGPQSSPPPHPHRVSQHALGPARHPAPPGSVASRSTTWRPGRSSRSCSRADPPGPSGFDNDASVLSLGDAELAKALQIAEFLIDQLDSLPDRRRPSSRRGRPPRAAPPRRARPPDPRTIRRPCVPASGHGDRARPVPRRLRDSPTSRRARSTPTGTSVLEEPRFVNAVGSRSRRDPRISPKFLYRLETVRGSPQPYRISDHELATRLSYFLWSTMPDDELFRLASEGSLHQARRPRPPGRADARRPAEHRPGRELRRPVARLCGARQPRPVPGVAFRGGRSSSFARSIASRCCSSTTWSGPIAACSS